MGWHAEQAGRIAEALDCYRQAQQSGDEAAFWALGRFYEIGLGVEQAHLGGIRVLGQHHIQDKFGVQGVAGAGEVVDAGQVVVGRIADGGEDDGGLAVLGGHHHDLGGQGADGDDGVILVGQDLSADLRQRRSVVVAVEVAALNGDAQFLTLGVQLGGDGVPDLVHGRMVQLPDDSDLIAVLSPAVGGAAGVGAGAAGTAGAAGAGGQGQGERQGQGRGQKLLHRVLFHGNTSIVCPLGAEICLGG